MNTAVVLSIGMTSFRQFCVFQNHGRRDYFISNLNQTGKLPLAFVYQMKFQTVCSKQHSKKNPSCLFLMNRLALNILIQIFRFDLPDKSVPH